MDLPLHPLEGHSDDGLSSEDGIYELEDVVYQDEGVVDADQGEVPADEGGSDVYEDDVSMGDVTESESSEASYSGSDAMSESQGTHSTIYPEDSISQRPPRTESSDDDSVKSIHEDDGLFRTAFGRTFNTKCDNYLLPVDGVEHSRHDVQHRILQLMLNSLYMPVDIVKRALTPSHDWEFPAVFDIGTGSGRWAIDMALEFPHCEVVGLDLVPPSLGGVDQVPGNCRFEVDDANLPLSHYANCFNVVHSRAIDPGVRDFKAYLYNVAQTLRPHGVLLLCSGTPQLYDENLDPCTVLEEGKPGFSWLQRFWAAVYTAYNNMGSTAVDAAIYWDDWLQNNPNYENVRSRDVYIPIGPWLDDMDERQRYVSELMRWNIMNISGSYEALLIADGYRPDVVHRLISSSQQEMQDLSAHTYLRWRYTWAQKRAAEWIEAPELPPVVDTPPPPFGLMPPLH